MIDYTRKTVLEIFHLTEPLSTSIAGALVAVGVQIILLLRRLYRHHRNDQIRDVFVRDMGLTHLPRIYSILEKVARANNIEPGDRPAIRWIDKEEMDGRNQ